MSADEDFLARWSRRKREVAEAEKTTEAATPPVGQDQASAATNPDGTPQDKQNPAAEFDLASLPPLDSITAVSDIRDFLRAGVPAELTRAALRRAWITDPAIRDFVGLAENAWDFTDPNAMPGFGPLKATDDVPKMLAQIMSRSAEPAEPEHSPPPGEIQQTKEQDSSSAALAIAPDDKDKPVVVEPNSTADETITPVSQTSSRVHESGAAAQQPDSEAKPRNNLPHRGHGRALPH